MSTSLHYYRIFKYLFWSTTNLQISIWIKKTQKFPTQKKKRFDQYFRWATCFSYQHLNARQSSAPTRHNCSYTSLGVGCDATNRNCRSCNEAMLKHIIKSCCKYWCKKSFLPRILYMCVLLKLFKISLFLFVFFIRTMTSPTKSVMRRQNCYSQWNVQITPVLRGYRTQGPTPTQHCSST